ncbi:MAG: hypothetical protein M3M96_08340 [Candidatus Eremiobacteraeota bacterium]|nr:hypothetical protein [Candidatus Eremiobacteraeota bacterium]
MFDIAGSLEPAVSRAAAQLASAANNAARAETTGDRRTRDSVMARVAEQAIFTEALLGAVRARLQELKSVAK